MIDIKVTTKDPLYTIYRANCTSIGRYPKKDKTFKPEWVDQQLLAEHSTLEFVQLEIMDTAIRGDVASHIVRHTAYHPRFVCQSKRPDWNEGQPRPGPETPRMLLIQLNPKALIAMARVRLCSLAMKETREWMMLVEATMCEHKGHSEGDMLIRRLGLMLKAECDYRGGKCPYGDRCCGKRSVL